MNSYPQTHKTKILEMQQEIEPTICKSNFSQINGKYQCVFYGAMSGAEGEHHVGTLPHRGGELAASLSPDASRPSPHQSPARWPKTTSPFALGRQKKKPRQQGVLGEFFFLSTFIYRDSGCQVDQPSEINEKTPVSP